MVENVHPWAAQEQGFRKIILRLWLMLSDLGGSFSGFDAVGKRG